MVEVAYWQAHWHWHWQADIGDSICATGSATGSLSLPVSATVARPCDSAGGPGPGPASHRTRSDRDSTAALALPLWFGVPRPHCSLRLIIISDSSLAVCLLPMSAVHRLEPELESESSGCLSPGLLRVTSDTAHTPPLNPNEVVLVYPLAASDFELEVH